MIVRKQTRGYSSHRKYIQGKGFTDSLVSSLRSIGSYVSQNKDLIAKPILGAVGNLAATGLEEGGKALLTHILNKNNESTCPCGDQVDARGTHGLSCMRSAGRSMRHSLINDIIHRSLSRAGVAAAREPNGLIVGSGLRPDGATLIPWVRGKCMAWDATTPDTLAASHLQATERTAGAAAAHALAQKIAKYTAITPSHIFVPVAVETLGAWNAEGLSLIQEIGRRASILTGDPREATFIFQRVSVAVQRGNVASFAGTLPPVDLEEGEV